MSTYLFGKQLPKLYSEVPAFTEIASYIQRAKILFSSLFIDDGQQLYILNKENHVYIQTDWQAYSLIRATARLMLTTGNINKIQAVLYVLNLMSILVDKAMGMRILISCIISFKKISVKKSSFSQSFLRKTIYLNISSLRFTN